MRGALILILACLILKASADPYELYWRHLSVPIRKDEGLIIPEPSPDGMQNFEDPAYTPEEPESEVQPNCSTWRAVPPKVRQYLWPEKSERSEYSEPVTVTVEANQLYDHYEERYRLVRRVETWVFRRSYYEHIINCNKAEYQRFSVSLFELEKGDRFQMRITWDDGSHRTIDQTMKDQPELEIFIDEPGYLEY